MGTHDLPKKRREKAHGDVATPAKDAVLCHVSAGAEIHFELIVPDSVFKATMTKPSSCTFSTRSGDMRRAILMFD
jgi:hypothetical protein